MTIKTYNQVLESHLLGVFGQTSCQDIVPGVAVYWQEEYATTRGIVLAIDDDSITVLWSSPPKDNDDWFYSARKLVQDEIDAQIFADLDLIEKNK